MSRGWWGDPLTSEDLHCSLMFKIWLVHHKNKFLPLSFLHAEELDRSTYPRKRSPQPQPCPALLCAHQWYGPNGSRSSGREATTLLGQRFQPPAFQKQPSKPSGGPER